MERHRHGYSFGLRARDPAAPAERPGGNIRGHGTGAGRHRVGDGRTWMQMQASYTWLKERRKQAGGPPDKGAHARL